MNYTEPYIPTPEDIIPKMLTLASVMPDETVFDLGSGDGRIVIVAAKDSHARVVGVEVRRRLVRECRRKVKEMGLAHQAKITHPVQQVAPRTIPSTATHLFECSMKKGSP